MPEGDAGALARLLRRLLSRQRVGRDGPLLARHRPRGRAGQTRGRNPEGIRKLRVLHQQARFPKGELGYPPAAQPGSARYSAAATPEWDADGDPPDADLAA